VAAEEKLASGQNVQNADQIQAQYMKTLDQLNVLWDNLDQKREGAEEKIDRLTAKLDRQDEQATELSDSFKAFKREIAREARHSRTDQPVKLKRILAFEASEEAKDREVAEVRLKHINLLSQLKQLEEQVKEKEELAEGLHLIDFEQLKIENQTLNEKIEERNDELHKLRKKTTTTVQVLTHIKEKLQFVQQENTVLDGELGVLETSVAGLRDRLTQSKKVPDLHSTCTPFTALPRLFSYLCSHFRFSFALTSLHLCSRLCSHPSFHPPGARPPACVQHRAEGEAGLHRLRPARGRLRGPQGVPSLSSLFCFLPFRHAADPVPLFGSLTMCHAARPPLASYNSIFLPFLILRCLSSQHPLQQGIGCAAVAGQRAQVTARQAPGHRGAGAPPRATVRERHCIATTTGARLLL
jgi:hypothetical protein